MHVVLTVVNGPRTGVRARIPEKSAITIGRSKTTDFHILDTAMSRVHAVIARDADGWYVEDQGSRNGTYLGDERVKRAKLRPGVTISFGGTSALRFDLEEDDAASAVFEAPDCTACGRKVTNPGEIARNPDGRPFHLACRNLDHLVGSELGEYRLDAPAPRLGEAFCFRAHQPSLHRSVLLEVYDPPLTALPGFRAALLEEVRRISKLLHPGILRIYAFDEARGMTFIVMEDFAGERLAQVLEQRRFSRIRGAVRVAENLLDAMVHALGHGTALPWLGPGRVLVSEDHAAKVKLLVTPRPGVRLLPSAAEAPYVAPEVLLVGESAAGPESSLDLARANRL